MAIENLKVGCYKIPTDGPEADGTISWDHTILVTVEVAGAGQIGFGYAYTHSAAAVVIQKTLRDVVIGRDEMDIEGTWNAMLHAVRNIGRHGVTASAIAAVDISLWDLKAKILDLSLANLLGAARSSIPLYGSGGFTNYEIHRLQEQLGNWSKNGIKMVKMKVGTDPQSDVDRVRAAREAVSDDTQIFVDANGAYTCKQALQFANEFSKFGVTWFEEPVPSDDLEGLALLRQRVPAGMNIAAGEYGYDPLYFRRMLAAGAVDVLQADGTRCLGVTGFMKAAAICDSFGLPFSAHTAPTIHAHTCCAAVRAVHLEYFYDHSRIEHMLFDGALTPKAGELRPDASRAGLGVEFKHRDAERFECRD